MYVNDNDLLYWAPSVANTDEELIEQVQQATSLTALKDGITAPSHTSILQPDGMSVPIQPHDMSELSKMLGVHYAPIGDGSKHIIKITDKGFDWANNIAIRPLFYRNTCMSFFLQLYPGISWSLVSVILPPLELESMMRKLYRKVLPILGLNRNITTEWRMLPEIYQGLGLSNFTVVSFTKKVFFLQCNWGFTGGHYDLMQFAFEAFLIEIGLYGDVFQVVFSDFGILATSGTWFKFFWELGDCLDINVSLHASYHI